MSCASDITSLRQYRAISSRCGPCDPCCPIIGAQGAQGFQGAAGGGTGGVNVFDLPLVENASNVVNLQPLLINVSTDDIYIVTYNGNTNTTVTSFDVMASNSYQINN